MEEAPLRKSDIPFPFAGKVMLVIMSLASASILYGVFTDAADRQDRPGILDGFIGVATSVLLVRILTPWLAQGRERWVLAKRGLWVGMWFVHGPFHPSFAVALFGSFALSAAVGFALKLIPGLRWPWVGSTFVPGFVGFSVAISYAHSRWYGSLPD